MRIGAEMPRYSREKLLTQLVSELSKYIFSGKVPFILDYLAETVHHAVISILAAPFALLQLSETENEQLRRASSRKRGLHSCLYNVKRVPAY